jgi:beta-lactamase superfamily II metal-dependent hydrolase
MNQPATDEVEITLLGRGVGECVIVHLVGGQWIIVDSFYNDKLPAARAYLDALEVDPSRVSTIVVTHFHTDHYRGVDLLHDYYADARFMITEALRAEQFLALYIDDAEPQILGVLPETISRARNRTIGALTPGLRHLKVGQLVYSDGTSTVRALSPTDSAVLQSNAELAAVMTTEDRVAVTSKLKDDNRCSVVLHVLSDGVCALLGADLVADAPQFGWQAVLDEPTHQALSRADLVKVPHHGGASAHDDAMWNDLVDCPAVVKVTPYWPSALPMDSDLLRLAGYGSVWQAAPSMGFVEDEFGNRVSTKPETGIVRSRRRAGEVAWRTEAIDPAFLAHAGP